MAMRIDATVTGSKGGKCRLQEMCSFPSAQSGLLGSNLEESKQRTARWRLQFDRSRFRRDIERGRHRRRRPKFLEAKRLDGIDQRVLGNRGFPRGVLTRD